MATEDGFVKIKVNMDITDVGAGVKDIGAQLKKAGDAAARAGKSMGKSLSKSGRGYDRGAMEFVDNFGKSMEGSAEAARKIIDAYKKAGVSADNAAKSVRELAEEERETVEAGAATVGEETADTIHKQVLSAQKALAELTEQGLGPGDAKWDEAYQAAAQLHAEEKAYLADLAKTPEQREREAAAIEKAAARAEELRRKEEARAEAVRQAEAAEAAEAQRLDDIAQSAQVGSQAVVSLTQELEQLQARQQELEAAGVGMGYEEYDANAERIRAITAALREYAATGSDARARTMAPNQSSWERFKQKILGVAASLGLVRKQTNDTSGAMKRLRTSAGTAASGVGSVFKKVLRWGLGIGSVTMLVRRLWGAVKDGLTIMAQHDTETANTLNGLKTALTNVKLSLATAFGPVLTAVAPLLLKLSDLVTRAANAVARFFAILSGKSTYKKAVAAQDAITDSVAGTGAAAKEAAKNLAGLDELNTWQDNKSGSGGGGGGAGSGSGVDVEEVETGAATDFEVRLKDILFNWDDLDPELIAEKILTGLCAAAGGIIGYSLGGTMGGLVGLTLGALLGVKLSQLTFNGDGKLNPEETKKLILDAVGGFIGGVLGFAVGGPVGAAIGFTVGAGIAVKIGQALFDGDGKLDKEETKKLILTAVGGILGGILGFVIGGPAGAVIGFTIGAGISVLLQNAAAEADGGISGWVKQKIFEPIKKGLKAAGELAVTVVVGLIKKAGEWASDAWDAVKNGAVSVKHSVTTALSKASTWVSDAWDAVKGGSKTVAHKVTTALSKAGTWVADAWTALISKAKTTTVSTALKKAATWVANAWTALTSKAKTVTISAAVKKAATWITAAWTALTKVSKTVTISAAVKKAGTWIAAAWTALSSGARKTVTVLTAVQKASTWVSDAWTAISSGVRKTITVTVSLLKSGWTAFREWLGFSEGGIYVNGRWKPIEGYASGGSPRSARLFYANENGMPELVGRIGSSTAVMNNGQIVASVAAGVYRAVAAAFGQIGGWFRVMSARLGDIPPAIEMLANMPAQVPQPVLATGAVIPPRTLYVDGPVQGLADAVSGLREALDRQGQSQNMPIVVNVHLNGQVDGKNLFKAMVTEAHIEKRATGKDPFAG